MKLRLLSLGLAVLGGIGGLRASSTAEAGIDDSSFDFFNERALQSRYIAFFWKSNLRFEAKLGNGEAIAKTVPHSSGVLLQDLNGCIAESVMTLLNDEKLRACLAQ